MQCEEFCRTVLCLRAATKSSWQYFIQLLCGDCFSGSQKTSSFCAKPRYLALKPAGRRAVSCRYAYRDAAAPGTAALRQRAIHNWPLFAIFSTGAFRSLASMQRLMELWAVPSPSVRRASALTKLHARGFTYTCNSAYLFFFSFLLSFFFFSPFSFCDAIPALV